MKFVNQNKEIFIGEVNANIITIDNNDYIIAVIRDVTEKRQLQEKYNNLLKNLPDLVYKMRISDGKYIYLNDACERILGFDKDAFYNNPLIIREILHPDYLAYFTDEWNKILNGNPSDSYLYKVVDSKGNEKWIRQKNNFEYDNKAKIIAIEGVVSDITEEKNAEIALKKSEEKLSRLLENMKLIAVNLDRNGDIKFCNKFLLDLTGWKKEEVIDKNWFDLFIPDEIKTRIQKGVFVSVLRSGQAPTYYENSIKTRIGDRIDILWNNTAFSDKNGQFDFVTSIGQDITEKNKILQEIKDSESKFKSYTENAPVGIFVVDEKGRYVDVNKKACELTGYDYDDFKNLNIKDIVAPDDIDKGVAHFNQLREEGSVYEEIFHRKKNGDTFLGGINAVKISNTRFIAFVDDLTEAKKAQEEREQLEYQLHRSQRLETIGTLVGGISHDFNNLLTPILGYADLIVRDMEKTDPNYDNIIEIFHAANHAKELINQMLNFSRNTKNNKKPHFCAYIAERSDKNVASNDPKHHRNQDKN